MTALFRSRTRQDWCELLEGTDACFAPVLNMEEAPGHPHNAARGTYIDVAGVTQPAPAPRFSRSGTQLPSEPPLAGEHTDGVLADWGFSADEIAALHEKDAIA